MITRKRSNVNTYFKRIFRSNMRLDSITIQAQEDPDSLTPKKAVDQYDQLLFCFVVHRIKTLNFNGVYPAFVLAEGLVIFQPKTITTNPIAINRYMVGKKLPV